MVSHRAAQNLQPLLLSGNVAVPPPDDGVRVNPAGFHLETFHSDWHNTSLVPDLRLALVNLYPCVPRQFLLKNCKDIKHTCWVAQHIQIIQECEEALALFQTGSHRTQCCVLPQTVLESRLAGARQLAPEVQGSKLAETTFTLPTGPSCAGSSDGAPLVASVVVLDRSNPAQNTSLAGRNFVFGINFSVTSLGLYRKNVV